jgi:hypothetical protein
MGRFEIGWVVKNLPYGFSSITEPRLKAAPGGSSLVNHGRLRFKRPAMILLSLFSVFFF